MKKILFILFLFLHYLSLAHEGGKTAILTKPSLFSFHQKGYMIFPPSPPAINGIAYWSGSSPTFLTATNTGNNMVLTTSSSGIPTLSSSLPLGTVSNQRVGYLLNDLFVTGDSTNYVRTQTNGFQTFFGGYATLTGGNGSFSTNKMYYKYNGDSGTFLEKYTIQAKFINTVNGTQTYGFGVGLDQSISPSTTHNTFACFIKTKSGIGTRGEIVIIDPIANTIFATSTDSISFTNSTDTIQIRLKLIKSTLFAEAINLSTKTRSLGGVIVPNTVTVKYNVSPSISPAIMRQGNPGVWNYGGTQQLYNLSLICEEFQNPKGVFIGDSRVIGLEENLVDDRYASLEGFSIDNKLMIWAKGSATIAGLYKSFGELANIINGSKCQVFIAAGINDIMGGHTLSQMTIDYDSLVARIQKIGCIPVPVEIAYVSTSVANHTAINNLVTTFNTRILDSLSFTTLDENTPTASAGALNPAMTPDGIHFNLTGSHAIYISEQPILINFYQNTQSEIYNGVSMPNDSSLYPVNNSGNINLGTSTIGHVTVTNQLMIGNIFPSSTSQMINAYKSANADVGIAIKNDNSGTTARAYFQLQNGTATNSGWYITGHSYTTSGLFVADAVNYYQNPNISGGLGFLNQSTGRTLFTVGGVAALNEVLWMDSANCSGFGGIAPKGLAWGRFAGGSSTKYQIALNYGSVKSSQTAGVSGISAFDNTTHESDSATLDGTRDKTIFTNYINASDSNTVVETSLIGSGKGTTTLPAKEFTPGREFHIIVSGYHSAAANPNITINIKLGSTVICTTGAVATGNGTQKLFKIDVILRCKIVGASGLIQGTGTYTEYDNPVNAFGMVSVSPIVVNTTTSQVLDVTATWGTAATTNVEVSQNVLIDKNN